MAYVNQKPNLVALLFLFALALVSRIYGIWEWDIVDDEYFTVTKASERYRSIVNPAYYFLVVLTYALLGPADWLARLPALLIGVISIPLLYFTWARNLGRNIALFASLVLVLSTWHLWYSQFARFYIGVFLFSSVAYFFFYRAIFIDSISNIIWAVVASVTAFLFHVTAIFVPFSIAIAYLVIWIISSDEDRRRHRNIKIYLIVSLLACLSIFSILFSILDNWVSSGQQWGYGSILILPQLVKYVQIPIAVSAFFGLVILFYRDRVSAIFFLVALLVPVLFLVLAAPFMSVSPYYSFYILPLIVILAGIALDEARKIVSSNHTFVVSIFPFFLLVSVLLPSFASHYLAKTSLDFGDAIEFVDDNYAEGDHVLSFIPGLKLPSHSKFSPLPYIGFERDSTIDWYQELQPIMTSSNRLWIIVSSKRRPIASRLEAWLFCNAKLVWQDYAVRLDYEVDGYQIYLATNATRNDGSLTTCAKFD